jgi:hypothetical protein
MEPNEKNREFQKLLKAAEAGDAEAQYNLGQAYEYGEYDKVDLAEAMSWYTKSARQGYVHAQFKLSVFHEDGKGCEVDFLAAYEWAEKAARQGLVHAQKRVSAFLQAAVQQGHRDAAFKLFEFYVSADSGRSISPDHRKWIVRAAELGVAQAQHHMAVTVNSIEEKRSWLRKAAGRGYQPAKEELNKMESAFESGPAEAEPEDMISRLRKLSESGDVVAKITLDSLLSSPLSPEKK